MATEKGRAARPSLKVSLCCETKSNENRVQNLGSDQLNKQVGVCGEHGGDPSSVGFFAEAGLDYVSCSPFR